MSCLDPDVAIVASYWKCIPEAWSLRFTSYPDTRKFHVPVSSLQSGWISNSLALTKRTPDFPLFIVSRRVIYPILLRKTCASAEWRRFFSVHIFLIFECFDSPTQCSRQLKATDVFTTDERTWEHFRFQMGFRSFPNNSWCHNAFVIFINVRVSHNVHSGGMSFRLVHKVLLLLRYNGCSQPGTQLLSSSTPPYSGTFFQLPDTVHFVPIQSQSTHLPRLVGRDFSHGFMCLMRWFHFSLIYSHSTLVWCLPRYFQFRTVTQLICLFRNGQSTDKLAPSYMSISILSPPPAFLCPHCKQRMLIPFTIRACLDTLTSYSYFSYICIVYPRHDTRSRAHGFACAAHPHVRVRVSAWFTVLLAPTSLSVVRKRTHSPCLSVSSVVRFVNEFGCAF